MGLVLTVFPTIFPEKNINWNNIMKLGAACLQ